MYRNADTIKIDVDAMNKFEDNDGDRSIYWFTQNAPYDADMLTKEGQSIKKIIKVTFGSSIPWQKKRGLPWRYPQDHGQSLSCNHILMETCVFYAAIQQDR